MMCGATALQTASQSVRMFIGARYAIPPFSRVKLMNILRFMIGFGLSFAANAAPMLVSEIAYPPHRAPLTSLYNSLWYSGSIM